MKLEKNNFFVVCEKDRRGETNKEYVHMEFSSMFPRYFYTRVYYIKMYSKIMF